MEPRFPFNRLAIVDGESSEPLAMAVRGAEPEGSGVRFDSSRSLRPVVSYPSSYDSLPATYSSSGSLTGLDSRRSLYPTSSLGSQEAESRLQAGQAAESLAVQPIAEGVEAPQPVEATRTASIASVPAISDWNSFDDADFGKAKKSARKGGKSEDNATKRAGSLQRRFGMPAPFAHLGICKKRRNCSQCRWDVFPGIRLSDAKARRSVGLPEPPQTGGEKHDSQSPRGPLSAVDSDFESTTRSSGMEAELARTFDLQDLEASEHSSSEASDSWNLSLPGSSKSQQSKAATAPEISSRPKEHAIPRSTTAPDLVGDPAIVKDTGKLRVERFKGITFVNEYALIRGLGKGSFGTVKLALHTGDHELYALKLIPKSRRRRRATPNGSPQFAEADVLQEITVMKELSHPNIVRLVEVIDDPLNSKMLMVLEYVEGGSVFGPHNPNKRFTELAARKYFRDVLQGLDYLHSHKVAHGDLKPDNLLLGANGRVKIADFGSSQLTRVCDLVNRTAGTPAFMAPEMCTGQAYHARMADVWALGVCLYMFAYGTVPFKSESIMGLYNEICNTPLTFPDHIFVSNSLKHLLARLLDKDPDSRMSLTTAMHHHWVTHNGAYPLPNIQGLEPDEEPDPVSLLMECWPDDPADIGLESVLKTISPLFEQRLYPAGAVLARQGDPAVCIYFIEAGSVKVFHTRTGHQAADSEEEEEDEEGPAEEDAQAQSKRHRLKRQGSMLKTMFCATVRASRLVSAVRGYAGGESMLLAKRGPGSFIGEVQVYEKGLEAQWQTCVKALEEVKVLVLYYKDIKDLISKRPEAAADVRAVMAQRKGELLKMEILERLAGMYKELREEVEFSSVAGGASTSAILTARELLGCSVVAHDVNEAKRRSEDFVNAEAALCGCDPTSRTEAPVADGEARERVEMSHDSFEAKGDSAKSLSLFGGGKTGSLGGAGLPPSPFDCPK